MADLVVDTVALHRAAQALAAVATIADTLAGEHGRAANLVPALGLVRPTHAADSFISEWTYGAGWIATQAAQAGANLATTAATYEAIEELLSAAVGGRAPTPSPAPAPPALVEPLRRVPPLRRGLSLEQVQLAAARDFRDLIPGDPESAGELGRRLSAFADQLADARLALARISLGNWVGASARAAAADLEELAARLRTAETAFAVAGDAVRTYAATHADAQHQAARALAMWQSAEPAAKVLRGVVPGPIPVGSPVDPEADLARAGALARDAHEVLTIAGRTLAEVLEQAEHGAPNDPGFFSRLRRAVTSFVVGTAEGVWGMAEGVVTLAALAVRANPARMIYDPQGYQASSEALYAALEHGVTHPGEVGAALIDLETWKDDPFRAAGRLVPDLVAIVATAGAVGAARGAQATERLRSVAEVVEDARVQGSAFRVGPDATAARVAELGLDPASPVGRAAAAQLQNPWSTVDHWVPTTFEPGQRFAIAGDSIIGGRVTDSVTYQARSFFEGQQVPAFRTVQEGNVTAPRYADRVEIFEVRVPIEGATAPALANRQLGPGGHTLTYVADLDRAVADGHVVPVRDHEFAPSTLGSKFEDPRFRMVDDPLPGRALNPTSERISGYMEAGAEEAASSARQMAVTAGAAAASDQIDEGAR